MVLPPAGDLSALASTSPFHDVERAGSIFGIKWRGLMTRRIKNLVLGGAAAALMVGAASKSFAIERTAISPIICAALRKACRSAGCRRPASTAGLDCMLPVCRPDSSTPVQETKNRCRPWLHGPTTAPAFGYGVNLCCGCLDGLSWVPIMARVSYRGFYFATSDGRALPFTAARPQFLPNSRIRRSRRSICRGIWGTAGSSP